MSPCSPGSVVSPSGASSGIARPGCSTAPCTGGRPGLPGGGAGAPRSLPLLRRGGGWRQVREHAFHCFLATSAETRATHQTDAHATNHHDTRHDRDDVGAHRPPCAVTVAFPCYG